MIWLLWLGYFSSLGAYAEIKVKRPGDLIVEGSLTEKFDHIAENVQIPGFITTKRLNPIASIIGPVRAVNVYLIGDRVYLRWDGSPPPRVGDTYGLYSPALVYQGKEDTTYFQVIQDQGANTPKTDKYRLAGYLYEPNGELQIVSVERGIVIGVITNGQKKIGLGDQLMLPMPRYSRIAPVTDKGLQLSASIALGSPPERISPTIGSFLYINRGSRDGVRIGQVFQVIEKVPLTSSPMIAPTESMGEIKVVYTTEAYSTALVTEQFNAIRLGGLLLSKQGNTPPQPKYNFSLKQGGANINIGGQNKKEQPATENLSELDALERRAQIMDLTPEERRRLEGLQAQDLKKKQHEEAAAAQAAGQNPADPNAAPDLPEAPKIGVNQKQDKKKAAPKRKRSGQDEQDLNQLMQF